MLRSIIAAALLGLLLAVCPVHAGEVEIERMTWMEIRDAIAAGKTTIIIPTGGTEQNGPHMVLGKHNFIISVTARRIAEKLGDTLVAPVLAYVPEGDIGKREGHMAFAGTISVLPETFGAVLLSAAESFKTHGFKTIVFLGEHGASIAPQRIVAERLSEAWAADGVRVINAEAYYNKNGGPEWLKAEGESDAAIGTHASIQDTSELLAVYPAGVRMDKRGANTDGAIGDATKASAERGQKLIDMKVDAAVKDIKAQKQAPLAPNAPAKPGIFSRLWLWLFG